MDLSNIVIEPSSYKDSDGFVFYSENKVYRKVSQDFSPKYNTLKQSGIYKELIDQEFLFPFTEIIYEDENYLESVKINFISYPYEWGFEQMKAAALFHLNLMEFCFSKNCSLKDASPFNIQFVNGKPILIDILSVEPYTEGLPWFAYRQFCESFLAPLILSNYHKGNWNRELILDLEGISLSKTASLLPFKARFNTLAMFHIIAHSKVGKGQQRDTAIKVSKEKILSIVKHLRVGIEELSPKEKISNWTNYLQNQPYSSNELELKKQTIKKWIGSEHYNTTLDVGANHTAFAKTLANQSKHVIVIDNDMTVIDQIVKQKSISKNILPLHIDITQVSPAIGLNLNERKSFFERIDADLTLALAVIHHIFHSRNIPLYKIAELFAQCSSILIIEFISESDEMFIKIQNTNNHHPYNKTQFEKEFSKFFAIERTEEIKIGKRFLYFMKKIEK